MRRWMTLLLAAALLTLPAACAADEPAAPPDQALPSAAASSMAAQDVPSITPEEGVGLLEQVLGTEDAETGNIMSYGYEDNVTLDGTEYYRYRVSWLVDGDHMSYLTDYVVSVDGTVVKEYDAGITP